MNVEDEFSARYLHSADHICLFLSGQKKGFCSLCIWGRLSSLTVIAATKINISSVTLRFIPVWKKPVRLKTLSLTCIPYISYKQITLNSLVLNWAVVHIGSCLPWSLQTNCHYFSSTNHYPSRSKKYFMNIHISLLIFGFWFVTVLNDSVLEH